MSPYLRVFFTDHIQDIEIKENLILGGKDFPIQECDTTFHFYQTDGGYMVSSVKGTNEVTDGMSISLSDRVKALFVLGDPDEIASIDVNDIAEFVIGRGTECDMVLPSRREVRSDLTYVSRTHVRALHKTEGWRILPVKQEAKVYINGKAISSVADVLPGDTIEIGKYTITVSENRFTAYAKFQLSTDFEMAEVPIKANRTEGARITHKAELSRRQPPSFNRGPHIRSSYPKYEVNLPIKERVGDKPEFNWISTLLPPVAMLAVMLAIYFISSNAMSLMYTVPMYGISMVVAVVNYRSQKKKFANKQKAAERDFAQQIEVIRKETGELKKKHLQILNSEYPSLDDCVSIVQNRDARMWRVRPDEEMFLTLRLGLGKVPTQFILKGDCKDKESVSLAESAQYLLEAPVTYPFAKYTSAGLVGDKPNATALMKNTVVQAATNHSYDELKLVFFIPERNTAEWDWVRWLPHVWNEERTKRYIASDYASTMRISREFEDELGKRAGKKNQGSGSKPYYLFIVADDTHLRSTELLHTLTSNKKELFASAMILAETRNQLPAGCNAVIEMQGSSKGRWYPADDENASTNFSADWISDQIYDGFSRSMAPVRISDGAGKKTLPSVVSFLEGYGVSTVEGLQIQNRWSNAHPGKSLTVPVGVKSNGEIFYFDIHEKKHGPHGIASGRAGSGKSEMVQSWILSLALNFRPDQVAFIIVDFKGDGLLAPFRKLPHLAGSISNLDHNFERNVVALQQEMNRRMALFSQHNVTDIAGYTQKYENGETNEAVPFLMVIVDEFAELKQSHPEFMAAIDRVYTIGRSLGIHIVILAQDAAAAASDMIQANSRFRWCMQVATADASRGMLGTADAYTMPYAPGRGFVKVGDFEVYEEIQSYWSGAPYSTDAGTAITYEEKCAFLSLDGTRTIFADEDVDKSKPSEKEISKVIEYIRKFSEANHVPKAVQIWQPPMPQTICLEDFIQPSFNGIKWNESSELALQVGMVDDPNRQMQYPLSFTMGKTGHISVQGSPESGKTTFLLSAAMSLANNYAPDTVEIYLFDYDKWVLNLVRNLPHVQGSTAAAEPDEVEQIIQRIRDEITERKIAFLQAGAVSLEGYNAIAEKVPAIFLLVDNISAAWDSGQEMDDMLEEVAMKGAGYGIYLIATAPGNIPFRLQNAFRTKLSLYQNEKSEYTSIVGRCEISPENYPGRGLARLDYPVEFQTALPVFGDSENERNRELHNLVELMKTAWQPITDSTDNSISAEGIPFIDDGIVLGMDKRQRTPVLLSGSNKHCLIVSSTENSRRIGYAQWLVSQLENSNAECIVMDDKLDSMKMISDSISRYFAYKDHSADEYLGSLMPVLQARFNEKEKDALKTFAPIWLVIMDFGEFFDAAEDDSIIYLKDIVTMGKEINVNLFVLSNRDGISALGQAGERLTHAMLRESHALLLGETFDNHKIFTADLTTRESSRELSGTEGWYLLNGQARRIELAT